MGGNGSGRLSSSPRKFTVEECQAVSVHDLQLEDPQAPEALVTITHSGLTDSVRVVSTPCQFGGVRWWIRCACGRRVVKVYLPPGQCRFACRTCHNLTYESNQEEHRFDRLFGGIGGGIGPGITARELRAHMEGRRPGRSRRSRTR
jgi:hypothetical protein